MFYDAYGFGVALARQCSYTKSIMAKQSSSKSKSAKKSVKNISSKVDYEPNKVGLAVAIVAVVSLVLIAIIVTS